MVTELIEFKLKENANETEFLALLSKFHDFFKRNFSGYAGLESTKGEDFWLTIMHWQGMEDVYLAGEVLRDRASEVAPYQALTDLSTMKLTFLNQMMVLD